MSSSTPTDAHELAAGFLDGTDLSALGLLVASEYGGAERGYQDFGQVCRLVASSSPSRQALLTAHSMVCRAIQRWGSEELRRAHLPQLARGQRIAAFALSEEAAGSDIQSLSIACEPVTNGWLLTGSKHWVTYGLAADVFLVFGGTGTGAVALLVDRDTPGVEVEACPHTSGFAEAELGTVRFDGCRVSDARQVGRTGSALAHVATDSLLVGRLAVSFASLGLAQAGLRSATERAVARHASGHALHERQLVRGLLADAVVAVRGAEGLCRRAANSMQDRDEWLIQDVLIAKLAASRAATLATSVAAQIAGAAGLLDGSPVDRMVRDARVYEVIEGNTQLLQDLVAGQLIVRYRSGADDD